MDYYTDKLSAKQLKQCYDIAPPRTKQYLEAEIEHVFQKIHQGDMVLELGCGFGRIMPRLCQKAGLVIGVDTSLESLILAHKILRDISNYHLFNMDAVSLGFGNHTFDCVVCIQNGISAFHVNQKELLRESIRVTKPGGAVLFSSYSDKFWGHRLKWFQMQSEAGFLGEIDYEKTRDGIIVCKDGFKATIVRPHDFLSLTTEFNVETKIVEVDESSLFFEITV